MLGEMVIYTLTAANAKKVNKWRADAVTNDAAAKNSGYVVHTGPTVKLGDELPMVITRVWADTYSTGYGAEEGNFTNGQVFLNGSDVLFVQNIKEGVGPGTWRRMT